MPESHNTLKNLRMNSETRKGFIGHFDGIHDRAARMPLYGQPINVAFQENTEALLQLDVEHDLGLFTSHKTQIIFNQIDGCVSITQTQLKLFSEKALDQRVFASNDVARQAEMQTYLANKVGLSTERLAEIQAQFVYAQDNYQGIGLDSGFMAEVSNFLTICQPQKLTALKI